MELCNIPLNEFFEITNYSFPDYAWTFVFGIGTQSYLYRYNAVSWAIRPGDVSAVTVPSAILLLGSGMAGLVGFRRFNK